MKRICLMSVCLAWMLVLSSWAAEWKPNPYLLLDEQVILGVDNLKREVEQPRRLPGPIIDGPRDKCFQPYVTVIRDGQTGLFRMWYGIPLSTTVTTSSSLAYIESRDGIHWVRPHRVLETPPIRFGTSVIDEGPDYANPAQRFKYGFYQGSPLTHDGGLRVCTSPDGIHWTPMTAEPVLHYNHDLSCIAWDPLRKRYMSFFGKGIDKGPTWTGPRRIPFMSVSDDLVHWREPWMIITPDADSPREQGDLQFYGMSGVVTRGDLMVGMAKILRDDMNSEPGLTAADLKTSTSATRKFAGLGYTVLVWSHDGENWKRDTEPFIDRNPKPGTWDRAMAWGDFQLPVGDEVFIYYGGYQYGHKAERFTTRQIGLARMPVDRYVGWVAGKGAEGHLRTALAPLAASSLTVNAAVKGGLRVRLCDANGKVIPGYDYQDCKRIKGDSVSHPVKWKGGDLSRLRGTPVQFVFTVENGKIFAFELK